jgi:hypothetical protein
MARNQFERDHEQLSGASLRFSAGADVGLVARRELRRAGGEFSAREMGMNHVSESGRLVVLLRTGGGNAAMFLRYKFRSGTQFF